MKIFLAALCLLISVSANAYDDDFCEGFELGYKEGYCYGQGYGCLEPLTPLCPLPRLGEDSFKGGYQRGFLVGLRTRGN